MASGFHDGVSKVWIMRADGGAIDVEGFDGEVGAIDRLVRQALVRGGEEAKMKVRVAVDRALRHLDEDDGPASEGE